MVFLAWLKNRWRRDAEAAKADSRDYLLAALPVTVGVVGAALLFPRAIVPVLVPLPAPSSYVLAAESRSDTVRVEAVHRTPLDAQTRELGTAFRAWNLMAFRSDDGIEHDAHAQAVKLGAIARGLRDGGAVESLLALRAVQMHVFLTELRRFADTGEESDELREVAGNAVGRLREVGLIDGHRLLLGEQTCRVFYKLLWNRVLGLAADELFALSMDDEREMARVQLAHPHASETERVILASDRARAVTPAQCDLVEQRTREAEDRWRLRKVEEWGARDAAYPMAFARGVLLFRLARYAESGRAFSAAREHGGAYALRAVFHERAALVASLVE